MKGVAKNKVVTSGRLTGRGRTQETQRRLAAFPEPTYSLYSSDSQEQVASLHNNLDRCDAFLSGILQADESDSPSKLGKRTDAAVKSNLPATQARKVVKKAPAKTAADRKSCHPAPHRAGIATPRAVHHPTVPVAHSGVKLHPAPRRFHNTLSQLQTPPTARQPNFASKSGSKSQHAPRRAVCASAGEDLTPVRDIGPQSSKLKAQENKRAEDAKEACGVDDGNAEGEVKIQTAQYLLRELKALIVGEGSLAEMLLRRLEQAMTSPLVNASVQGDADALLLQIQNVQLRRQVEELQQQLKLRDQAELEKANDLCSSQASVTQQDLTAALSQLRDLQDSLSELQKAHQDTQNQLRDKEMINALIMSDLEATRKRLLDSEREKGELATQYQQRLEEVAHLKSLVSQSPHRDPSEEAAERITHYLMTLTQPEATANERSPQDGQAAVQRGGHPGVRDDLPPGQMSTCTMSQCDVQSQWSDWSLRSGSTLDARNEAAFRDGLSALDTTIANLLKSIQLDQGRMCS